MVFGIKYLFCLVSISNIHKAQNLQLWINVWSILNKIKYTAIDDNFNQNKATMYLLNDDTSSTTEDIIIVFMKTGS